MNKQYIIDKIKELLPDEHSIPHGVLYSQLKTAIQKDVSHILNTLLKDKQITYSRTLNNLLININENE